MSNLRIPHKVNNGINNGFFTDRQYRTTKSLSYETFNAKVMKMSAGRKTFFAAILAVCVCLMCCPLASAGSWSDVSKSLFTQTSFYNTPLNLQFNSNADNYSVFGKGITTGSNDWTSALVSINKQVGALNSPIGSLPALNQGNSVNYGTDSPLKSKFGAQSFIQKKFIH
jgi:hypothetical protein